MEPADGQQIEVSPMKVSSRSRIFSDQELIDLVTPAGDKATQAIRAGDIHGARQICETARFEHLVLAGNYSTWNAQTLVHVYQKYGASVLSQCIDESLPSWFRPVAELFRNGVTTDAVSSVARLWRVLGQSFGPVTETDDQISFPVDVQEKGWLTRQDGTHGSLPSSLEAAVEVMRVGPKNRDFHVFVLALLHAEALMVKWLGYPAFIVDFNESGLPKQVRIYKAPLDIPSQYFERLGKVRDERRIRGAVSIKGGTIFSPNDLARMSSDCFSQAISALNAGEIAAAIGLCQQSKNEWYPAHHALRDWVTGMTSFIYRSFGVDASHEAVVKSYEEHCAGPMLDAVANQDLRDQVIGLASGFRTHAMHFRIEEDDDKFVFVTEPCGSGGRLVDEGAYSAPKNFALIKEKHEATFFLEDFPIYCMHCPSTNIQVFNRGGPYFLMVDGELMVTPNGNCNFYIFKNPDAIPERFYIRAGRNKESCRRLSANP